MYETMEIESIKAVYFIGAGGIGMSAIVRYFLARGIAVAGYDRTESELTRKLNDEGAAIHYVDNADLIPQEFRNPEHTLVVYTPAIPDTHSELRFFRDGGFCVQKRAQVLGILTRAYKALCVAGTHGKTTTTAMTAHLLQQTPAGCNAFLGGISKNYGTNCLLSEKSEYVVIEADEFDRSFHWLSPYATVITAADADHLDIYGTREAYLESFRKYTSLIVPGGVLVMHCGLDVRPDVQPGVRCYTYSRDAGDFHAERIRIGGGEIMFDYVSPLGNIADVRLGVPVSINIENGIAAMALAQLAGVQTAAIRQGMAGFAGVDRRFDFKIKNDRCVLLSDYAHHPAEIKQSLLSLREVFGKRRLTVLFQPHLYTRTRDFYTEFADSLSLADEVILTDIYPAREQPIEGVNSRLIYDRLREGMPRTLCRKENVPELIRQGEFDVLAVLGAGDLDRYIPQLVDILNAKYPSRTSGQL